MTADTDSGSSATSLESFVSSAFDGWAAGTEPSDDAAQPTTDVQEAPGTQPVETDAASGESPSDSDGDQGETTDLVLDDQGNPIAAPDPGTTDDADDYDALVAQATPLSYRANGKDYTFEDLKVIPGKGAIIADDALPKLQQRLSEREALYENSQQQYQKYQDLERLTSWKTVGADGKEQVLTGAPALEAQRVLQARTEAINTTIAEVFDNLELFRSMLTVDANNQVIPDKHALNYLMTRAENAAIKAERSVQQSFQAQASAAPSPQMSHSPDVQAIAPTVVENTAKQLGLSTLTPEDKTYCASMLPRFIRPATMQDVALSPDLKVGQPVVDAEFGVLLQREAAKHASNAKTVQQASKVSTENAARLAAAQRGKTVVQSHTRNIPHRQQPRVDQRAKDADDAWNMMHGLANGRFPSSAGQ